MTWTPAATVTIAGTDYTGDVIETVRITRGREDVYSESRAGYMICELVDLDGDGFPWDVLDDVVVTVHDSTATDVTVFTGRVSDWSAGLYDAGAETGVARSIYTLIATGPLALLNRRNVGVAGRAAEKDGDRIAWIVGQALAASWEETSGTWATVAEATTTWATVDTGYDPTRIDTPGVYDIAALAAAAEGYNPLAEANLTALSGRGFLYDDPDGFVAYGDADSRATAAAADYLTIPKSALLASGIQTTSQAADIVNRVAVEYDGGAAIYSSSESILAYGVQAARFTTNLEAESDAAAWALDYLEDHQGPTVNIGQVTMRLDLISDDSLRDDLIGLDVNDPVFLEELPPTLAVQALPAFVEGIIWDIGAEFASIALYISDAALSIGSIRWNLVPQTLTWNAVNATLTWDNARSL